MVTNNLQVYFSQTVGCEASSKVFLVSDWIMSLTKDSNKCSPLGGFAFCDCDALDNCGDAIFC